MGLWSGVCEESSRHISVGLVAIQVISTLTLLWNTHNE
jgi:hypothetical protein